LAFQALLVIISTCRWYYSIRSIRLPVSFYSDRTRSLHCFEDIDRQSAKQRGHLKQQEFRIAQYYDSSRILHAGSQNDRPIVSRADGHIFCTTRSQFTNVTDGRTDRRMYRRHAHGISATCLPIGHAKSKPLFGGIRFPVPVSVEVKLSFLEPGRRWAHSPSPSKAPGISYQGTMKTSVRMLKTSGGL